MDGLRPQARISSRLHPTQSVIDQLSKDETVPSVIARLSGRFVCSSRSRSISIARSGLIIAYRTPRPTLIRLPAIVRSVRKTCADLVLCFARLRTIAILVTDDENARQIAIGAKKIEVFFVPNVSS